MHTRITSLPIIPPSHHSPHRSQPLPKMHNPTLHLKHTPHLRRPDVHAIQMSANVPGIPEVLPRYGGCGHGGAGIEDHRYCAAVEITGPVCEDGRDCEFEDCGCYSRILSVYGYALECEVSAPEGVDILQRVC